MGHQHTLSQGYGEVSEWFKEPVLKTSEGQTSVGSNPTLSAITGLLWRSTQEAKEDGLLNR